MKRITKPLPKKSRAALRAGERIRATRESRGWSVPQLSKATGNILLASRISNYEQGLRELPIDAAEILGEALDTHAAYLMGLIDDTDKELLSFPPAVRTNALSTLKATASAARENSPRYVVGSRVRTPAIARAKTKTNGEENAG